MEPPNEPPDAPSPTSLAEWLARKESHRGQLQAGGAEPAELDRQLLRIIDEEFTALENSTSSSQAGVNNADVAGAVMRRLAKRKPS
jgi:hypothetical protein